MKTASPLLLLLATALLDAAEVQPDESRGWRYTLLAGSTLTETCSECGRPTILARVRGTFNLRLVATNRLSTTYALDEIDLAGIGETGTPYRVAGTGELRIAGESAITQRGSLEVRIEDGPVQTDVEFATGVVVPDRLWPMLDITFLQTNGTLIQSYGIRLVAAPFREVWFSTNSGLTSGTGPPPYQRMSSGDLLSSSGDLVRRNVALTRNLGIMPAVPDLGLDAFDMRPAGEVTFSMPSGTFSETLGPLGEGDLVAEQGAVVRPNQSLLAAFGIRPPVLDARLDAVMFFPEDSAVAGERAGRTWFSIAKDQFSERLGLSLQAGDVLSDDGVIIRTNEELLRPFRPEDAKTDHGLDALYVWPSGEIWFSTERGFIGERSRAYFAGDILSDQGYVVFRNLDLLGPFAPLEDLADFGVDALWVVSDAAAEGPPPGMLAFLPDPDTGDLRISWESSGRVFEVEGWNPVDESWESVSPIAPQQAFVDPGALLRNSVSLYRVVQW